MVPKEWHLTPAFRPVIGVGGGDKGLGDQGSEFLLASRPMLQLLDQMCGSDEGANGIESKPAHGMRDGADRLPRAVRDAVGHLQDFAGESMVSADHLDQIVGSGLLVYTIQDLLTGGLEDRKATAGFIEQWFQFRM